MELRHLEHFVAVAEERNFTRAARRLHIAQSGLSVSVRSLERSLNVRLFERTSHAVELTEAGTMLLDYAQAILRTVREATAAVEEVADGIRGTIRLGLPQVMVVPGVGGLLQHFRELRPLVTIEPHAAVNGSGELLERLDAGELDLALICTRAGASHPGFRTAFVRSEPLILMLPPRHELLDYDPVPLSALAGRDFVEFRAGYGTRQLADAVLAEAGVKRTVAMEASDEATVAELVRAGVGLAFLPSDAVPAAHGLKPRTLAPEPELEIRLASSLNRPLPPAARLLQQVIRGFYAPSS
jgi:DNA-binding transcriptional LysR family regulator